MQQERPWIEALVACIPHPLAFVRSDWTILWANREFSQLIGREKSLKGAPLDEIIPNWSELRSALEAPSAPGLRVVLPTQVCTRNDEALPVEIYAARAPKGLDAAWAFFLRETQQLNELLRRLAEKERSHSFLQAHTSDLILRTDAELVVTWSNDTVAPLFPAGKALSELVSKDSIAMLQAGADAPRFAISLHSEEGIRPAFFLSGIARRLVDDEGRHVGFSLLLHDDSEHVRLARFSTAHSLSTRETEVIEYVVKGYSNLNIASILGLSESGVKFHLRNVFNRAKVATRTELMALFLEA